MMAASPQPLSLRRLLDLKLVFEAMADGNGLLKLQPLIEAWPAPGDASPSSSAFSLVPRHLLQTWRELQDANGYLSWEGLSGGLEKALEADRFRLERAEPSPPGAMARERDGGSRSISADIERVLGECSPETLVLALAKSRKELYSCQRTLHSNRNTSTTDAQPKDFGEKSAGGRGGLIWKQDGKGRRSSFGLAFEKEELVKGIDALQRTHRCFADRLRQLSMEQKLKIESANPIEEKAEELLSRLGKELPIPVPQSKTLQLIEQLNTLLVKLESEGASQRNLPPSTSARMPPNTRGELLAPTTTTSSTSRRLRGRAHRSISLTGKMDSRQPLNALHGSLSVRDIPHQATAASMRGSASLRNISSPLPSADLPSSSLGQPPQAQAQASSSRLHTGTPSGSRRPPTRSHSYTGPHPRLSHTQRSVSQTQITIL